MSIQTPFAKVLLKTLIFGSSSFFLCNCQAVQIPLSAQQTRATGVQSFTTPRQAPSTSLTRMQMPNLVKGMTYGYESGPPKPKNGLKADSRSYMPNPYNYSHVFFEILEVTPKNITARFTNQKPGIEPQPPDPNNPAPPNPNYPSPVVPGSSSVSKQGLLTEIKTLNIPADQFWYVVGETILKTYMDMPLQIKNWRFSNNGSTLSADLSLQGELPQTLKLDFVFNPARGIIHFELPYQTIYAQPTVPGDQPSPPIVETDYLIGNLKGFNGQPYTGN